TKDVKSAIGGRIARLEAVDKPYEPWALQLSFGGGQRSGDLVAGLEDVLVRRGSFELGPLDLDLFWGDRLVVTGPNGSGKTTLLDVLLGRIAPVEGRRRLGRTVVLGELEQRREAFVAGRLLDAFADAAGLSTEASRTLLAKFGLGDVVRASSSLSPGERTRAVLGLLAARGVNCLVLDEPTNHLDVEAIEELERALAGYDGTVVLVTHDRLFLERFGATRTIELGAPSGNVIEASGTR